MGDGRQKDIVLLLFAIQLSGIAVAIPQLTLLLPIAGVLSAAVLVSETTRRFT